MTKGVLIRYGDIAVGARERFELDTSDKSYFSKLEQLKKKTSFPNYTNPCELYSTVLDGSSLPLPSNTENGSFGWWSEQISNEDGYFDSPIVLVATSVDLFTSVGITLVFDTANNVYAKKVNIRWYKDEEVISEKMFFPDKATYFFDNKVEFYNKLEIEFFSINMPKNRLKIHELEYGFGAEFTGRELKGVKIIQQLHPLSTEIAINTCDFELVSLGDFEYSFQNRQEIKTYFNGEFVGKTFVKDFKRKTKTQWSIKTEDYIGIMDSVQFLGGVYENAQSHDVLRSIFETAKIPYSLDTSLSNKPIQGYIPITSCREALMQVCFAIGAVADTSGREDVLVYPLSDELKQEIPLNRIMQGQSISNETKMTAFELTAHEYIKTDENIVLYEAEKSGSGENIFIKFSQPVHSLSITDGSVVSEPNANYAVINAGENCVLSGQKYEHKQIVKSKKNPLVLFSDTENIISANNATLVSPKNVDNVLERCYNYFVNADTVNAKIVERRADESVKLGDLIEVATEFSGTIKGRPIKQSYSLNGGIIVKDTVVKQEMV